MYRIAICEDKPGEARALAGMIRELLEDRDIPYRLDVYGGCEALLSAVTGDGKAYHLLFLDILMDGLNGMECARQLRRMDQRASIVFVTVTMEFVLEGYTVRALRYLPKPVDPKELRRVLEEDYTARFRFVTVRVGSGQRRLPLGELLYIEAQGHNILCHLREETVEAHPLQGSFTAMAEALPRELVRCHRCYVVNIRLVGELRRSMAVMENDARVPVGRKWFNPVQDAYLRWTQREG